jgi:hypothetical protein
MPPSPTAAAQRFTEPERTSPAAKMPGQLVSSGASSPSVLQGLRHVRGQCKRQSEIALWEGRLGRDCTKIASEPI